MIQSCRNFTMMVAIFILTAFVSGCGGDEVQVIEQTPEMQESLDAYNEQMDQPSPGV